MALIFGTNREIIPLNAHPDIDRQPLKGIRVGHCISRPPSSPCSHAATPPAAVPAPLIAAPVAVPITASVSVAAAVAVPPLPRQLSPAASQRWRQICHAPLRNMLAGYGFAVCGRHLAFTADERARVRAALEQLGPPGSDIALSLQLACIGGEPGKFAALRTLLQHQIIDANMTGPDGLTLLQSACLLGHDQHFLVEQPVPLTERIATLTGMGAEIDHPPGAGLTLLQQTWERDCRDGNLAAGALIAAGCDPWATDGAQRTLLHRAAHEGNLPVVRGWCQTGLPPNPRIGLTRVTPIMLATSQNRADVIRLLVEGGLVAINARNSAGATALHLAASAGHLDATRALLDSHAHINTPDGIGLTPLHYAVITPNCEHVRDLLLQRGANPDLRFSRVNTSARELHAQSGNPPWPEFGLYPGHRVGWPQ